MRTACSAPSLSAGGSARPWPKKYPSYTLDSPTVSMQGANSSSAGSARSSPIHFARKGHSMRYAGVSASPSLSASRRPAYSTRSRPSRSFAFAVSLPTAWGSPAAAGVRAVMCTPDASSITPRASAPSSRDTISRSAKPMARTSAVLAPVISACRFKDCFPISIPSAFLQLMRRSKRACERDGF